MGLILFFSISFAVRLLCSPDTYEFVCKYVVGMYLPQPVILII